MRRRYSGWPRANFVAWTIAALVMLTASEAGATCAWLMWSHTQYTDTAKPAAWTVLRAYTTSAECESNLEPHANDVADGTGGVVTKLRFGPTVELPRYGRVWFRCLPDTIDPRGPKGSAR